MTAATERPANLKQLRESGWHSKTVKQEIRDNFLKMLLRGDELFPGIIGYENTVLPEINIALIAGHDLLFLGEKGQAKSRLMRSLVRFLADAIPYVDDASCAVHEDPYHPITKAGKLLVGSRAEEDVPIAWWPREQRYAERLAPGTKFADIIGEIDPAKLAGGVSMAAEEALHFGLIPRPIQFDIDVLILFSANPTTYNRSGKVIPQLKDRIGSIVQTHYPLDRNSGMEIMQQEAGIELDGDFPVLVPPFMLEIVEQVSRSARKSKYVDHASGVSARLSIANYRTMVASARQRGVRLGEKPAVPRISDLGHLTSSSLGKLELDMMGSHQMSEKQVLEAIQAEAIKTVFEEYVSKHGLQEIVEVFGKGVKIEVGDQLPSSHYAERIKRVPRAWEKAFEVNPSTSEAVRASCVEFVLAGLYAGDKISRSQKHGRVTYEL